ncbi:MAG: hypothetical protein CR986_01235 [Ignavibacteriae bacterium]|nr:MAG: hypothetical protein CR986_01235 [Ignavibacteriota bacterium]
MKKFIFVLSLFLSVTFSLDAKDSLKIKANRLTKKINLDGKLNEPIYKQKSISGFIQKNPDEGKRATEKTNVWISYDNDYIYFSAELLDSEADVIDKTLLRKDYYNPSDWFFIYIDTYNDDKSGYFFGVNAGGSQIDGTIYNDSWMNDSWDGIWESKTSVNNNGWSLEVKIPFSQVRFKEAKNMTWGVNFNREIKRNNEETYLVMVPKKESGFVSHFVDLVGLNGITSKQRLEVRPYVVQKAQYLIHDQDDPFYKGNRYPTNIGADIKIGLGSNFNLDATINPDFGQVEVDPAVVNLSAFETYFSEKRPFFIEGENLFEYGYGAANNNWFFNFGSPSLFYSRRIGHSPSGNLPNYDYKDYPRETRILGAAKLTGKVDESWTLGALSATTERTYAKIITDGIKSEHEVEPFTHYGVVRSQKEFNNGKQALGFMVTSVNRDLRTENLSDNLVKNAYNFGIDGWTFLDSSETYILTGFLAGSHINGSKKALTNVQKKPYHYFQRPDNPYMSLDTNRTTLNGYYSRIALNKQKGNFFVNASVGTVSPGFENSDLGFQWMDARINGHVVLGYRWYEPDNLFRKKIINFSHFENYDFQGNNTGNGFMLYVYGKFMNYYWLNIGGNYSLATFSKTKTRGGPIMKNPSSYSFNFNIGSDSRKKIVYSVYGHYGNSEIDEPRWNFQVDFNWKPSSQISFSFGPNLSLEKGKKQWIGNFEDPYAVKTYKTRYVFGDIDYRTISGKIRLNWTITPQISLQLFMQPLMSIGKYSNFKELAEPRTFDFNKYKKVGSVSYNKEESEYTIDPDGSGDAQAFTFSNPDFNFKSLRSTIVFRWEVLPGSIFYLVWSHDRTNFDDPGKMVFGRDFKNLMNAETNNIFLAKFSYWLDI